MQMPEKVGKPRTTVFPMICGSGGSKSRLAKAAGAEPCGHMRDEKLHAIVASSTFPSQNVQSTPTSDNFGSTPLWHEAHFQAKMYKTHQGRSTFGSWDVEKVRAIVARSTFPSQNVQNTPGSEHFWKLRCRKSARRCGTKHISKSKGTQKHQGRSTFGSWDVEKVRAVVARSTFPNQKVHKTPEVGAVLEVEMAKKCTQLWREAHFQIKRYTTHQGRSTFGSWDVEKVHAVVAARSTCPSQKCKSWRARSTFGRSESFRCHFACRMAGARDCAPCQKWKKDGCSLALPKTMAGVGPLKRIWIDRKTSGKTDR